MDQIRATFRSVAGLCGCFVSELADIFGGEGGLREVTSDSTVYNKYNVYEVVPRWWRECVRWCEEVVHMHDTIVI